MLIAQQQYDSAQADIKQAEASAANARAEELRYLELVKLEEVSHEQYDQRATNARTTDAVVVGRQATARAALKTVGQLAEEAERNQPRQIAVQHASEAERQANAKAEQSQVNQASLNLTYCKIPAPVLGVVGDKTVEVGMEVASGQELFAITRLDDLWMTANFIRNENSQHACRPVREYSR